jgi:hypothetical protein
MHRIRRLSLPGFATALLLLVGACASVAPVSPRLQGLKTVGIISAVADDFTLTQAGLTGLAGADRRFSIEPWGVDDFIISRASAVLSRRFQVQDVTYRRAPFAVREPNSAIVVMNLLRDDPIKALVRTEVSPQRLDAYIVVTKATSRYGARGRPVSGIGVINHAAVFGSYAEVYALYMIRVIDGRKFEVIDKKSALPLDSAGITRLAGPSRMLDASTVPMATANEVASNDKLKAAVIDLVERSLEATLQDLQLPDGS